MKVELEKRRAALSTSKKTDGINSEVGFYLLAAPTPVQEAIEPLPETVPKNRRHGLLTTAILEELQPSAASNNDVLWVRQLIDRVSRRLPQLAKERQSIQTPFPFALGADFPIAATQ